MLKKINIRVVLWTILTCLLIVGIVPLIVIGLFNHPSADEYACTWEFMRPVILSGGNIFDILFAAAKTSMKFYEEWQGLYTGVFFTALSPMIFGEEFYCITTPLLLAISLLGFMSISYSLCKYALKDFENTWVALSLIAWLTFTQLLPSPVEGLYWFNGAAVYVLFWTFCMLTIACAIVSINTKGIKSVVFLILATILAFILAGGNYVTSVCGIIVLASISLFQIIKKRHWQTLIPLVFCIFGFILAVKAPGVKIRAEVLGTTTVTFGSLFKAVINAGFAAIELINSWMNLSFICYIIALIPFGIFLYRNNKNRFTPPLWLLLVFPIYGIMLLWLMLCPPWHALGNSGEGRLINVLYMVFLVLSAIETVIIIFYIGNKNKKANISETSLNKTCFLQLSSSSNKGLAVTCLALILLLFSFGSTFNFQKPNWKEACDEFTAARTYSNEQYERVNQYLDETVTDVEVKPLSVKPALIYFTDISEDPDGWQNKNVSHYYGKKSVRIATNPEEE